MDYSLGKICQLIILIGILPRSFQKCSKHQIYSYYYNCWMRIDREFCYKFDGFYPMLDCLDLGFLVVNEDDKSSSKIMKLRSENNSLSVIKAKTFVEFHDLVILDIGQCNVKSIQAEAFQGLSKLELLELRGNSITTLSEGIFRDLKNLKTLQIADNKISKIEINTFSGNTNLTEMYINKNSISDMSTILDSSKELTYLDISSNQIKELKLLNNTKLSYLNIAYNNIQNLTKEFFGNTSLVYFDISNNGLENINDNFFENFRKLENLNMSFNPLFKNQPIPIDFFKNTEDLEALNLSSTSISKINLGVFSRIRYIKVLDLSKNELTHISKWALDNVYAREIYINNNRLSYLDYKGKSDHVNKINLNDNLWNCDILSSLLREFRYTSIIKGNNFNTTNVYGIKCHEVIKHEDVIDGKILQEKYLSYLIDGANNMTDILNNLKDFLNETDSHYDYYSYGNIKGNALLVTDIVLYVIFFGGVIFAIFGYVYYKKHRNVVNIKYFF